MSTHWAPKKICLTHALIWCALHQREEAVWEPSGWKRLLRLTRPHPIMRILAGYSPMPPRKLRPDFLREVVTLFKGYQKVPLKKNVGLFSFSQFSKCAPFVQHRYPQGVASLDDHVDSSMVASKYLGEIRRIRRRHLPRCSTVELENLCFLKRRNLWNI